MFNNISINNFDDATSNMLADRIVYLRTTVFNMTQKEFSDALNISQSYLSLIEKKQRKINKDFIIKLLNTFNIGIDDLCSGDFNITNLRPSALTDLSKAYGLSYADEKFIESFLMLSSQERASFINSIKTLSSFTLFS